jgi:hypothetical protein
MTDMASRGGTLNQNEMTAPIIPKSDKVIAIAPRSLES